MLEDILTEKISEYKLVIADFLGDKTEKIISQEKSFETNNAVLRVQGGMRANSPKRFYCLSCRK